MYIWKDVIFIPIHRSKRRLNKCRAMMKDGNSQDGMTNNQKKSKKTRCLREFGCMCVNTWVCVNVCAWICMHLFINMRARVHIYTYGACINVCIDMCICMYLPNPSTTRRMWQKVNFLRWNVFFFLQVWLPKKKLKNTACPTIYSYHWEKRWVYAFI